MNTILVIIKTIASIFEQIMGLLSFFKKKKETAEHAKEVIEVKKEEEKVAEEIKSGDVDKLNEDLGWKE